MLLARSHRWVWKSGTVASASRTRAGPASGIRRLRSLSACFDLCVVAEGARLCVFFLVSDPTEADVGLQERLNRAVRETLRPGEDLVAAVAVIGDDPAPLFRPHKVLAVTTTRLLLLDYYGVVGRHAKIRAGYDRRRAAGTMTKLLGLRLLHVHDGPGPRRTYRAYIRCSKSADVVGRVLEDGMLADLTHELGAEPGAPTLGPR